MKELGQLHKQMCFTPVNVDNLTTSKKKKAMEALSLMIREERQHYQRLNGL